MTKTTTKNTLLTAALSYAKRGWQVFPVHSIGEDGLCTCGKTQCKNPAKHPRTASGFKDATASPDQIKTWWEQWPNANIGIATGKASGIVVLDVDPKNGGFESLELLKQRFKLPSTATTNTGGGGLHYYFQHPDPTKTVRNRTSIMAGLDIRADGGYIVAPPSKHISGNEYTWK